MFGNLGTHVIKNPVGTYCFVGSLPLVLADLVEPTKSDIMAGRYVTDPDGKAWGYKFPTFATKDAAIQYATDKGVEAK